MSAPVAVPDWRERVQRLADQLTADGDLHTPAWRDALLAVPRHEFVPRYYVLDSSSRPATWARHEPDDPASTARWLELVYSPTTLVIALADYAGRGVQTGIASSTKPDLMIRMLEALQVTDGMRVLEIGTGTGYNAALLSHRLGDRNVCSVDIDPALVADAHTRLARLGYHPTLVAADGADGLAGHAPFDRIIATCSVRAIPAAWIHQLRPGGLVLVHLEGPLGAGNLLALHRGDTSCSAGAVPALVGLLHAPPNHRRPDDRHATTGPHHRATLHSAHHGGSGGTGRRQDVSDAGPALPATRSVPQHPARRRPDPGRLPRRAGRLLVRDHSHPRRRRLLHRARIPDLPCSGRPSRPPGLNGPRSAHRSGTSSASPPPPRRTTSGTATPTPARPGHYRHRRREPSSISRVASPSALD